MNGFAKIDNTVIERMSEVGTTAFCVFVVLQKHADESGKCWPSIKRIAAITGLSKRGVQRALAVLSKNGWLTIQRQSESGRGDLTNLFLLHIPPVSPDELNALPRVNVVHGPGEQNDLPRVNVVRPNKNHKNKTHRTRRGKAACDVLIPDALKCESFQAAWGRWQQHRREMKKSLTPSTAKMQLKRLASMGTTKAIEIIDYTIEKGWTGLFEPGSNGQGHATESKPQAPIKYFETSKK